LGAHFFYFYFILFYFFFLSKRGSTCYIAIIRNTKVMPAVPPKQETGTAEHPCPGVTRCAKVAKFTELTVLCPARRKPGLIVTA
jgi:hypothetical protein